MTTELTTVQKNTPYNELKTLFNRRGIHHLLVEDKNGKLAGIISTEDLARSKRFSVFADKMLAEYIMTDSPTKLRQDSTIREAIQLFLENHFRALPIVNEDDIIVGIVTPFDIMYLLLESE